MTVRKKALDNGLAFALSACRCVCCVCGGMGEWRTLTRVVVAKELLCAGVVEWQSERVMAGASGGREKEIKCRRNVHTGHHW